MVLLFLMFVYLKMLKENVEFVDDHLQILVKIKFLLIIVNLGGNTTKSFLVSCKNVKTKQTRGPLVLYHSPEC